MMQRVQRGRCHKSGAEVSFARGQSVFCKGPKCLHEGPRCLDEGPWCIFPKGPKCPIGTEEVGAKVVGAEVSKIHCTVS